MSKTKNSNALKTLNAFLEITLIRCLKKVLSSKYLIFFSVAGFKM